MKKSLCFILAVLLLTLAIPANAADTDDMRVDCESQLFPFVDMREGIGYYDFCGRYGNRITKYEFQSCRYVIADGRLFYLAECQNGCMLVDQSNSKKTGWYSSICQVGPYFLCMSDSECTDFDVLDSKLQLKYTQDDFTENEIKNSGNNAVFTPVDCTGQMWICKYGDLLFLMQETAEGLQLKSSGMHNIYFTSCGEVVLEDALGYVMAFEQNGDPITVEGKTVFLYYGRSIGGTAADVCMTDGSWKLLGRDGSVLYDRISMEWTDCTGIVALLEETASGICYQYFDYKDHVITVRKSEKPDNLHYLGVGNIYYELLGDKTRLWDYKTNKEIILPFPVDPLFYDGRIALQTGCAVLSTSSNSGRRTAFVDEDFNITFIEAAVHTIEDKMTGSLYLVECWESGNTVLYDAYHKNKLMTCEGNIEVWDGVITEICADACRLYTIDGTLFFEHQFLAN